ncbi:probable E3 SUMO-protein ligase RNF212 isoform X2 [Brienomyrus brachyistius]|uniref:probable E3 SUMO-protein ligase RNF212 isoform X2 n=1 Tax=Brienomyrus brachyistius TaxID=42636 RepID=UPI0020B2588A|nr:probable E3 SUMO-protein ligase RNF212 isoform X2 [Brienomyrus brachyistius]
MPSWVCCNSCFLPPAADLKLAISTCGHTVCSTCFQKGKKGECLICKAQCQVTPLSHKSSSEVKALFSDISVVATNYFSEISKVLQFQTRHRKRLLAHYQKRIAKLEEHMCMIKKEMQEMNKKMAEQKAYIAKLENALKHQSAKAAAQLQQTSQPALKKTSTVLQLPYAPLTSQSRPAPSPCSAQPMEVDGQDSFRKPETAGQFSRLSLIGPASYDMQDSDELSSWAIATADGAKHLLLACLTGTIHCRSSSQSSLRIGQHSERSTTDRTSNTYELSGSTRGDLTGQSQALFYRRGSALELPAFKAPPLLHHSSMSSLEPHPFSLARMLPK